MNKYASLGASLEQERADGKDLVKLSFGEVEASIVGPLPKSALQRDLWWTGISSRHALDGWLRAGWVVIGVDIQARQVTFVDGGTKFAALYRRGGEVVTTQVGLG